MGRKMGLCPQGRQAPAPVSPPGLNGDVQGFLFIYFFAELCFLLCSPCFGTRPR